MEGSDQSIEGQFEEDGVGVISRPSSGSGGSTAGATKGGGSAGGHISGATFAACSGGSTAGATAGGGGLFK